MKRTTNIIYCSAFTTRNIRDVLTTEMKLKTKIICSEWQFMTNKATLEEKLLTNLEMQYKAFVEGSNFRNIQQITTKFP